MSARTWSRFENILKNNLSVVAGGHRPGSPSVVDRSGGSQVDAGRDACRRTGMQGWTTDRFVSRLTLFLAGSRAGNLIGGRLGVPPAVDPYFFHRPFSISFGNSFDSV